LYVVNLGHQGTIGRLRVGASKSELFAQLPSGSIGNGIRFDRGGRMYVADYRQHNIFLFEPSQNSPAVYFHADDFTQPNDLAIAPDGTLYASDPDFKNKAGRVWRIAPTAAGVVIGAPMSTDRKMVTPNGLDLSPDGQTLYVSESSSREIWAYRIDGGKLADPRRVIRFKTGELDGLRVDGAGRIYVARPTVGLIAIVTSAGVIEREVSLTGKEPTNLTFGGGDGKTVYVTQKSGGFIESFRVDIPGRER
jgi:signal peptidase